LRQRRRRWRADRMKSWRRDLMILPPVQIGTEKHNGALVHLNEDSTDTAAGCASGRWWNSKRGRPMEIPMKEHTIEDTVEELLEELDGSMFLLIRDDSSAVYGEVYGAHDHRTLVLVGRCLAQTLDGRYLDGKGRWSYTPPDVSGKVAERIKWIQRRIAEAQDAGVTLALCFHVPGDPLWRFVWTGEHGPRSAAEEMRRFILCGLDLEAEE
jgi:hypothetical protein